ncbi:50S ribosomal protein L6 [Patescibacteria group bacterium]
MSRVGKQPVEIPNGVEIKVEGLKVMVKGAKGQLEETFKGPIKIEVAEGNVVITPKNIDKPDPMWGTARAKIQNMVMGVTEGFKKELEINGVGYRGQVSGKKLTLELGFSHPIEAEIPEGLEAAIEKNILTISGIDKEKVGLFADKVRRYRKPEPYKGTGVKYVDEHVRRKEGKKAAAAGAGE